MSRDLAAHAAMKVSDLQDRESVDELTVEIVEKEEPRDFESGSDSGRVCTAIGEDDTDQVKVTLWNEEIDQVEIGDTVRITDGWSKRYQGEMEVSSGRYGELEVVD